MLNCKANPHIVVIDKMIITDIYIGTLSILDEEINDNVPIDEPIIITFSKTLNTNTIENNIILKDNDKNIVPLNILFSNNDKTVSITSKDPLIENMEYLLIIESNIKGIHGEVFEGYEKTFKTLNPPLTVEEFLIDDIAVSHNQVITNVDIQPEIKIKFSAPITIEDVQDKVYVLSSGKVIKPNIVSIDDNTLNFTFKEKLDYYYKYSFYLSSEISIENKDFEKYKVDFYTKLDLTPKFPIISDDELLTLIQKQTFKYFWDLADPTSGLARGRNTTDIVTIGGSGFGIMAIIVAIERGFITRDEGIKRLHLIVDYLTDKADRFHGIWPHWLNSSTGKTIPFLIAKDNGADLVESAFMMHGLLTVRQYLNTNDNDESLLIDKINVLWNEMEWDWHRQNNQNVLYWHWSENYDWQMNHPIRGWNEALIIYVLAASSPTHSIPKEVYDEGWALNGKIKNNNSYYGIKLPLGENLGGPLFFSHYSFLGLDPRKLSDQYANYWEQNVAHSKINYEYCVDNPKNYMGYSQDCWGLTASDNHKGYSAHSPTNDLGVITPTAAISSIPYTPKESMQAIKHFYYILGDKMWGEYGFYDAFNVSEGWYATSYIAIDQGPIICMIENYRTGLLWDLFMSAPEVQAGLQKLGFTF